MTISFASSRKRSFIYVSVGTCYSTRSKVAVVFAIKREGTAVHSGARLYVTRLDQGRRRVLKLGARREENTWSVTDSFKFPSFSIAIAIYISARLRARVQVRVRRSRELQKDSSL